LVEEEKMWIMDELALWIGGFIVFIIGYTWKVK